jgi:hypothetical protein
MQRAEVEDAVNRVQAKSVDVIFIEPIERVLDEEAPHAIAAWTIEVKGLTPGCVVTVGEVRTKLGQVIPFRAEVIVDDIEYYSESFAMTGVHQLFESARAAVGRVGRVKIDAVVTPVAAAGKLGDGHQLEGRNSQFFQSTNPGDDALERSFGGECTGMELVEDVIAQRDACPTVVGPDEGAGVDNLSGTVNAQRLGARDRIGPVIFIIQHEAIKVAGVSVRDQNFEVLAGPGHGRYRG